MRWHLKSVMANALCIAQDIHDSSSDSNYDLPRFTSHVMFAMNCIWLVLNKALEFHR